MYQNNHVPVITIDGPSGTGKGTITQRLGVYLKWHILDSGALYRILAYVSMLQAISFDNVEGLVKLALTIPVTFSTNDEGDTLIYFENSPIHHLIRNEQIGQLASKIAALQPIRDALLKRQRDFATMPGLVTDGRDMGTVVFPKADLKLYLYATPEERAERRYNQLKDSEIHVSLLKIIEELKERDERDINRKSSPLRPAEDAVFIDTTGLSIDDVFEKILSLIKDKKLIQ